MSKQEINSYYFSFQETGNSYIDEILISIAEGGDMYHNTIQWQHEGVTSLIQRAADKAATKLDQMTKERDHWKANHNNMVKLNQLYSQRIDLPVDRIPVYRYFEEQLRKEEIFNERPEPPIDKYAVIS